MSVINIVSIYSDHSILAKEGSSENLYQTFDLILRNYIVKKKNKLLYSISGEELLSLRDRVRLELLSLLQERINNPPKISDWKGRFLKEEIYHTRIILGKEYELYSGGIDSCVWGVSVLFDLITDSLKGSQCEILLFYSNKRNGLSKIKSKLDLLKKIRSINSA